MTYSGLIGVVGGMGPYAGVDLVRQILDETVAAKDQDHLPVALWSVPHRIVDRSAFLDGRTDVNPADAILEILRIADRASAAVAGIPCNTAHHPSIFGRIAEGLAEGGLSIKLLSIVEENARYIREHLPEAKTVGVLATAAAVRHRIYADVLERHGFNPIAPADGDECGLVNDAIFSEAYGIKAFANPVSERARRILVATVRQLGRRGADAVILGCTELPLAVPEAEIDGIPLIDSTRVLARALIREVAPEKLRPARRAESQPA